VSVGGRVPVGRVVATADVATFQADPQVQPRRAHGEALRAPVNLLGQLRDVDVVEMGARAGHAVTLARPEQFVDRDANQDHRLVFCQEDGTPLHPDRVSKLFARTLTHSAPRGSRCTACGTHGPASRYKRASTRRS